MAVDRGVLRLLRKCTLNTDLFRSGTIHVKAEYNLLANRMTCSNYVRPCDPRLHENVGSADDSCYLRWATKLRLDPPRKIFETELTREACGSSGLVAILIQGWILQP